MPDTSWWTRVPRPNVLRRCPTALLPSIYSTPRPRSRHRSSHLEWPMRVTSEIWCVRRANTSKRATPGWHEQDERSHLDRRRRWGEALAHEATPAAEPSGSHIGSVERIVREVLPYLWGWEKSRGQRSEPMMAAPWKCEIKRPRYVDTVPPDAPEQKAASTELASRKWGLNIRRQ